LVQEDLKTKMVFIAGPRQSGKTTIAKEVLRGFDRRAYFNLDNDSDRRMVLRQQSGDEKELVVFDELHNYGRWKRWLERSLQYQTEQADVSGNGQCPA
jgi:uncharacterized protein